MIILLIAYICLSYVAGWFLLNPLPPSLISLLFLGSPITLPVMLVLWVWGNPH